jgi:DNA repair protein RadC
MTENIEKYRLIKEVNNKIEKRKIDSSKIAFEYARDFWHEDIEVYESFFVLMLNRANKAVGYAKISQGGIAGTVVDVRLIAKYAVDSLCSGVIIFHNHPSGNLSPSAPDIKLTKKIKNALGFFDIQLTDHLIVTETNYYSFKDEGEL